MYTVAQILQPEFGRSWYEAVALVQEVAARLASGATLPSPGEMYLDRNGTLTFGFTSHTGQPALSGLAGLLLAAVEGIECPAPIRALAADTLGPAPQHPTVESFARALAFFERPDRAGTLRALGERLTSGPSATASAEIELQKLRERLSGAAAPVPEPAAAPAARRANSRVLLMLGVAVVTGLALGG